MIKNCETCTELIYVLRGSGHGNRRFCEKCVKKRNTESCRRYTARNEEKERLRKNQSYFTKKEKEPTFYVKRDRIRRKRERLKGKSCSLCSKKATEQYRDVGRIFELLCKKCYTKRVMEV